MFHGLYVALITPFAEDGTVNTGKLKELVRFHLNSGTRGLVVCGTTGENACLDGSERRLVIRTVVEESAGKLVVVAGAGARSTRRTLELVGETEKSGADAALVVTPYYNRPGQEGLYRHFRSVAEACPLPMMLYNVPSRTGVDLLPRTVARLARVENIAAIKEASPDLDRITELVMTCGDEIAVLTGHDPNYLPMLSAGGKGVVSVAGNVVPLDMALLQEAFDRNDMETARGLHFKIFSLCRSLFMETNPIPVKAAMNLLGWEVGEVRLPLVPLESDQVLKLKESLQGYGFLLENSPP